MAVDVDVPNTGDNTSVVLWFTLFSLAVVAVVAGAGMKKRTF